MEEAVSLLSNWLQRTKIVEPYSQLAYIYDYVMRHVSYHEWATYLSQLFSKADINVKDVLDISCGTGNLVLKLSGLGFNVAGFDESSDMVKVAKAKIRAKNLQTRLWRGSMQQFWVARIFHAVICTYDSLNYCLNIESFKSVFKHVAQALCSGGLFIFDLSTTRNSRKYFQDYYDKDKTDDFEYIRRSYYLIDKKTQVNEFHISWKSDQATAFKEIHQQRIYKINEIKDIIPSISFQLIGVYDGFSMRPGTEKSDRVHFVVKRV